jgi:LysR family transcriptional regulator, low CO2-responsive transcriptional regulator
MHKVTLRRLEVLLAVVDEGGFAAAADRLGISQPSVSAHIKALERAVLGPVFQRRIGRRPVLSDLGHTVLDHARQMLAEAADLDAVVLRSRDGAAMRVVFSCQRSLANFVFKDALTRFALDNRDIELVIRIGKQEEVAAELRGGVADLGCFLGNETPHGLSGTVIGHQRLVMVAAPGHPLAARASVTARDLAPEGFVGPPPSSHFGRALYRLLARIGIAAPRVVAQSTEYAFLRELVAAGVGISGSPESSFAADIASGRLVRLPLVPTPPAFDVRLVQIPQRTLAPPALRLVAALRAVLDPPQAAD